MSDIQRDREERQHVIEVLKSWDGYFIGYTSDEVQEALRYAINSIKTDLKYDLLYEETSGQADKPTTKNNLGVDCISRKAALDITWHDPSYSDPLNVLTEVRDKIKALPSVTPQEPILDKVRAEIEQDAFKDVNGSKFIFVNRINQIIDKYKGENEG